MTYRKTTTALLPGVWAAKLVVSVAIPLLFLASTLCKTPLQEYHVFGKISCLLRAMGVVGFLGEHSCCVVVGAASSVHEVPLLF